MAPLASPSPVDEPAAVAAAPDAPKLPWRPFKEWFRRQWKPGEHMSVIGPTGTGKTTLALELIRMRRYVVVLANKPADPRLAELERRGFTVISHWPRNPPDDIDRYLLWPRPKGDIAARRAAQRKVFEHALEQIFQSGGWTLYIDEARIVADPKYLGLSGQINELLMQGRTQKISVVLGFQRPSWVPQEAYDQPSYLFIAADNDRRNVQRFREIGGADGAMVAHTVRRLGRYEWAFIDARPGRGMVSVVKVSK